MNHAFVVPPTPSVRPVGVIMPSSNSRVGTEAKKSLTMTDKDEEMHDVETTASGSQDNNIATKILSLVKEEYRKEFEVKGCFTVDLVGTKQLKALRDAQPEKVTMQQSVGSDLPELFRYNISTKNYMFLELVCKPGRFYVRSGYKELFDRVCEAWKGEFFRVCLLGNAGTGKSWFQIYALKQLLDSTQERQYDIVIRHVDSIVYVIDLAAAIVYDWETTTNHVLHISSCLKRTLYFFEPGDNSEKSPLGVSIPSLSTLSPYEKRIKEYSKRFTKKFYFWPWSFVEMWAVVLDANLSLDFDEFCQRYYKFGGILRNVLGEDMDGAAKLTSCLKEISVDILSSIALNIDREAQGNNVSGYLVCYDNRLVEGHERFSEKNLEFTSLQVEEEVAARLHVKPMKEKMQCVLARMNGEILDMSGKMLESAAMELLSEGTSYSWEACEVGAAVWESFSMTKKTKKLVFSIEEVFSQSGVIIAPTKVSFPVIDFLCSLSDVNGPVVSFQCTWQPSHPFTVRALYDLRCNHMKVGDDQIVEIYLVTPGKENAYVLKQKNDFLDGLLDVDLKFTKKLTVPASRLSTMWENTRILVVKPRDSWERSIQAWLASHC